ncbi:MAG TPA: phospholipase A [Sulfuricurvum sp.]|nr:phospholipase A [Sulfuricurvum sp.]
MNSKNDLSSYTKKVIVALCVWIPCLLLGNEYAIDENLSSEKYFNEKQYEKALPLLEDEAIKGIKPSIYRLAYMYQNGLGVKVNYEKASFWFQQAASEYSYTLVMDTKAEIAKKSFLENLHAQMNPATNKEGNAYILQTMDIHTPETSKLFDAISGGDFFGLHPYETNFLLPFGYSTHKYPHIASDTPVNTYPSQEAYYDKNLEAQFQISLTKMLTYNLFGWNEYINFAYTQKVWWQIYSDSSPFRETNYIPELFIGVPTSGTIKAYSGLKLTKFGFIHESNGQDGYRSRSWNRLYLAGLWQWNELFLTTRVWYRIPESKKYDGYYNGGINPATGKIEPNYPGDDNPDIQDYLGYGDIKLKYLYNKHEIGALLRYNFGAGGVNRGAIDAHWSYPFLNSENTFWYVKLFSGYGESLIDYDRSVTKAVFGFSFSRDLF